MKNKKNKLTTTQKKFVNYIDDTIQSSQRIIFYKSNGHFGMDYAISSRFKHAKILNFKQLKKSKKKTFTFNILHIALAIISVVLCLRKGLDIHSPISETIDNFENIFLGLEKEKSFLKYVGIKKFSFRYKKVRFVIRVNHGEIENQKDIETLKLLCDLVKNKKINNSILVISAEYLKFLNLSVNADFMSIPSFHLTENDVKLVASNSGLDVEEKLCENNELIQKVGLQVLIDNFPSFIAMTQICIEAKGWFDKIGWLLIRIMENHNIDGTIRKQMYPLLEFASFFNNTFSKLEIVKLKEYQFKTDNLDLAQQAAIISQLNSSIYNVPTYFFEIPSFRDYFAQRYLKDLEPMPKFIFDYFRTQYPFDYIPALKVLHVDSEIVTWKERQSLIVIAYYYEHESKGVLDYQKYVENTSISDVSKQLIIMHEQFKKKDYSNAHILDVSYILNQLQNYTLSEIASCAAYVMLLQTLKENYVDFPDITFSKVLQEFKACILAIETSDNYNMYWKLHFKCQYIALSLEDEETSGVFARRFLKEIEDKRQVPDLLEYIRKYQLRGFSRIDLLSFSLGYDNAGDVLKRLYLSADESSLLKELARINYSAYLIENEYYVEAEKVLKKANRSFLKSVNNDTYFGYLNNLYVSKLGNKSLDIDEYISIFSELSKQNISYNDKLIIKNNLLAAYLKKGILSETCRQLIDKILETGNPYSCFYATHNLLSFYFEHNESENFNIIYEKIRIPKLLLGNTTFFQQKFEWMQKNLGQCTNLDAFEKKINSTSCYNNMYLFSSIERWFE